MRQFLFLVALFISFGFSAQEKRSIFLKVKDAYRLMKVRTALDEGDYDLSTALCQKYLLENQGDARLTYRLALSELKNRNYSQAIDNFEKVLASTTDVKGEFRYDYASALQKKGAFEKAKSQNDLYLASLKKYDKSSKKKAERLNFELEFAQNLIQTPVQAKITNLGSNINTSYDEYGPAVLADGSEILFTSRRPSTTGGKRDPYDSKYLEDIYSSLWNDSMKIWQKASALQGKLNTDNHDGILSIAPSADQVFIYRNEGDAGKGAGDIYVSRKLTSGMYSSAKTLGEPINTTYFESSASITGDGKRLFFISEDKRGMGRADIYYSDKISSKQWSKPVNLGDQINTEQDERMVFVHPNGNEIYFSSNGHASVGGYDIYKSTFVDGKWTTPQNLGYPINTFDDEINFSITQDRKKAYISKYAEDGFGGLDLFEVDLSSYDISVIKNLQYKPQTKKQVKEAKKAKN